MNRDVLIIGIGNPDRGDDAAGRRVAEILREKRSEGVMIIEHSGEGTSLLESFEGAKFVILIDAVVSGAAPGTIHRFDASKGPLPAFLRRHSTHSFGPAEAVEMARALGKMPGRLLFLGLEGANFEAGAALSPAVRESLPKLAEIALDEAAGEVGGGS